MVLLVKSHRIYVERSSYMIHRLRALVVALAVMIVVALLAQLPATAQTQSSAAKAPAGAKVWTPPRTPDVAVGQRKKRRDRREKQGTRIRQLSKPAAK